ncbi:glycosyltransferase [Lactobacillus sp. CRM56-3]|uniref:Glycosyltransferase n=2 Tax=Secundilactobacillus folii TaxID=2678357 RepID=A0A7X3C1H6_9LACO|nr:glycosyltransferase family 2 protein [Secundilactobacillus folii]MTV81735.1 glycosyltransferase [Secundilactobacillus folii]
MDKTTDYLSIVVPVYNEAAGITETIDVLENYIANRLEDYEILFVDDGSTDNSVRLIQQAMDRNENIKLIELSRNFGHQVAITAGLRYASGDAVVIMAADLQDPPAVIPDMIEKWHAGNQVVYGQRVSRDGENLFHRFFSALFYRVFRAITHIHVPLDAGDFRLLDQRVVRILRQMNEPDPFLRGMVSWVGFKQTSVRYERQARTAKNSNRRGHLLHLAMDGITAFSAVPLKIATWIGSLAMIFGLVYLGIEAFIGLTTLKVLVFSLYFLVSAVLVSLGIIGSYLFRVLNATKHRPLYIVASTHGFSNPERRSIVRFQTNHVQSREQS